MRWRSPTWLFACACSPGCTVGGADVLVWEAIIALRRTSAGSARTVGAASGSLRAAATLIGNPSQANRSISIRGQDSRRSSLNVPCLLVRSAASASCSLSHTACNNLNLNGKWRRQWLGYARTWSDVIRRVSRKFQLSEKTVAFMHRCGKLWAENDASVHGFAPGVRQAF